MKEHCILIAQDMNDQPQGKEEEKYTDLCISEVRIYLIRIDRRDRLQTINRLAEGNIELTCRLQSKCFRLSAGEDARGTHGMEQEDVTTR